MLQSIKTVLGRGKQQCHEDVIPKMTDQLAVDLEIRVFCTEHMRHMADHRFKMNSPHFYCDYGVSQKCKIECSELFENAIKLSFCLMMEIC